MEGSGLSGRMYTSGVGILGLEMPLHTPPPPQNHLQKHPKVVAFNHHHHQHQNQPPPPTPHDQHHTQLSIKQPTNPLSYNNNPKSKSQMTNSDDDENSSFDGKRKGCSNSSPWQRMKWTDNMVRLLIMAVYYIGDEAGNEAVSDKKKVGGLLQKKGKWKSVSKAMMEKGFYVSPQQCEDKFNDLNKRYKRVNDILGRGTACKVVENQSLLDSMDIMPKLKDEVRKLLNSKHLFFREMCAYHNSCGHGPEPAAAGVTDASPAAAVPAEVQHTPQNQFQQQSQLLLQQQQQHQQQQLCLHSSAITPNGLHKVGLGSDDDEDDDDDEHDEDEFEDEDDDQEHEGGGGRPRKRARTQRGGVSSNFSQALQQLNGEIMGMLQDGSKNCWEKKQWMNTHLVQLQEQGLKFKVKALELEKQRLKWLRFSSKKEREMEKMKIGNERKRLENDRMMLLLRQKEIELIVVDSQHPSNPSCVST